MAQSKALTPTARRSLDARHGIARQDMATGLAGLFRPVIRGKRAWVEGIHQPWNGGILEFAGPELDAGDLLVLLACQVIALRQHEDGSATKRAGKEAAIVPQTKAQAENKALEAPTLGIQTAMAEICRLIGRDPDDGRAHAAIKASLKRLSAIVVEARAGGDWATTQLLASPAGNRRGAVTVALNYRLTRALLGEGSYGRIDVQALAALPPITQVLAAWLACWRPGYGQCPAIGLDTLCGHVWREPAKGSAQQRDRRRQAKKALAMLPKGEWLVSIADGMVSIERIKERGQPVFSATQTRVFGHAPLSKNRPCTRTPHEMGRESTKKPGPDRPWRATGGERE
ncbi:MAG: replication protein C, IncQ-type [Thiomonas sp.]